MNGDYFETREIEYEQRQLLAELPPLRVPIMHITLEGYLAGVPLCFERSSLPEDDLFAHYHRGMLENPDWSHKMCADCVRIWKDE